MKAFLGGLVLGIVICGIAWFLMVPGIKQTSYDSGVDAGTQKGIVTGTAAGIEQAAADARHKLEQDSVAAMAKTKEATQRAAHRPRKSKPPTQNWHMENNRIGEPIE